MRQGGGERERGRRWTGRVREREKGGEGWREKVGDRRSERERERWGDRQIGGEREREGKG